MLQSPILLPTTLPPGTRLHVAHPDAPDASQTEFALSLKDLLVRIRYSRAKLLPLLEGKKSDCTVVGASQHLQAYLHPLNCEVTMSGSASVSPSSATYSEQEGQKDYSDFFGLTEALRTPLFPLVINLQKDPNPLEVVILSGLKTAVAQPSVNNRTVNVKDPEHPDPAAKTWRVCWIPSKLTETPYFHPDYGRVMAVDLIHQVPHSGALSMFVPSTAQYNVLLFKAVLTFVVGSPFVKKAGT